MILFSICDNEIKFNFKVKIHKKQTDLKIINDSIGYIQERTGKRFVVE